MIERHRHGDEQHEPLDRQAEQPRRVELHVDGADQHRVRQEPRRDRADHEDQERRERCGRYSNTDSARRDGIVAFERRQADEQAENQDRPVTSRAPRSATASRQMAGRAAPVMPQLVRVAVEIEPAQRAGEQQTHEHRDDEHREHQQQRDHAGPAESSRRGRQSVPVACRRICSTCAHMAAPHRLDGSSPGFRLARHRSRSGHRHREIRCRFSASNARQSCSSRCSTAIERRVPGLSQEGRGEPAGVERRQRPQQVVVRHDAKAVAEREVVDDAGPEPIVEVETRRAASPSACAARRSCAAEGPTSRSPAARW